MKTKNVWILLLCLLAGLTVGNFLGALLGQIDALSFLNYSRGFGLENPVNINLGALLCSLQIRIQMSIAGILGMLGAIFVYKKI